MKTKTLLIAGALAVAGFAIFSYNKVTNLIDIFSKMTIQPVGLRNLKVSFTAITFNLDIDLKNPTSQDFAVSGYVATLKRLVINYKGQFLGVADVNIDEVAVPKFNSLRIKDLPVVVAPKTLVQNIMTITSLDYKDLQITAVIEALGTEYTITQ